MQLMSSHYPCTIIFTFVILWCHANVGLPSFGDFYLFGVRSSADGMYLSFIPINSYRFFMRTATFRKKDSVRFVACVVAGACAAAAVHINIANITKYLKPI